MEKKNLTIEIKEFDSDERTIAGYASTFGFPADSHGDIVSRGAFVDSVQKIKKEGIPLLMDHNTSVKAVLGTVVDAFEDDIGLYIKARLAKTDEVDEIRKKLMQGHLSKMSIGFFIEKHSYTEDRGQEIRVIEKVNLVEVSVVTIPANDRAKILAVKHEAAQEQCAEELQEDGVSAEEATEDASPCQVPEGISLEEKQSLERIADLMQQSLNQTRRKYYGK